MPVTGGACPVCGLEKPGLYLPYCSRPCWLKSRARSSGSGDETPDALTGNDQSLGAEER